MGEILEFFDYIKWFFSEGAISFFDAAIIYVGKWMVYSALEFKFYLIKIAFAIGQSIISDFGITQRIEQAFGMLNSETTSMMQFFGVIAAIKNIVSALFTRFVLNVMGW